MLFNYGVEVRRASNDKQAMDSRRRNGQLTSLYRGIYIPTDHVGAERQWLAQLQAAIIRAGPGSAASHRSAARLHGLDGFDGAQDRHIDVIAPMTSTARGLWATRTRTLTVADITVVNDMAVTSLERTLFDLGSKVSMSLLELGLESALRGCDSDRPDVWNEALLARLTAKCHSARAHTGGPALRRLLAERRIGARPTGSIVETMAMRALINGGFAPFTQARIQIVTKHRTTTYWTDLADLDRAMVVEIDGLEGHGSAAAQDRDHRRQNIITDALDVLRFSATAVRIDSPTMVKAVMRRRAHLQVQPPTWIRGGFRIDRLDDGWRMTRIE